MSNEEYIKECLDSIDVKLRVILATGTDEVYNLRDTSFSLIRKAAEACGFTIEEEADKNSWSCDYLYSIWKDDKRIWLVEGSLWYGDVKLSRIETNIDK